MLNNNNKGANKNRNKERVKKTEEIKKGYFLKGE